MRSFCEDRRGILWLATANGLQRFDRESESFHNITSDPTDPGGLAHNRIRAVYEDRGGTLWVGTGMGADHFSANAFQFSHLRHRPGDVLGISGNQINTVLQDHLGGLWVGSNKGVDYYKQPHLPPRQFKHEANNEHSLNNYSY